MSTEWIQVLVVLAVFIPLTLATGAYLRWRRWDRERREMRQAKRQGLQWFYDSKVPPVAKERDLTDLEARQITRLRRRYDNPGFSVKVP